ncbi:tetratricopeptide repeat protein [Flavobacteriaceae bacterium M23B6Z8]
MKKFFIYVCSSVFTITLCYAQQPLQKGFNLLENGDYAKAEVFFEEIIRKEPENKTAKLCYGRAVGLNGQPEKALAIFTELRDLYPSDFEIKLNYAEALLWNKRFDKAQDYYKILVSEQPESFSALLGYANTLSNLKAYEEALEIVNKALAVSPGNPNALLSKKYIRLGFANQYSTDQKYEQALVILAENLKDFPNDKETLLNIANIYLITKEIEKANQTYQQLAINKIDSILAFNGMALAAHLDEKDKKALELATKSLYQSKNIEMGMLKEQTQERYAQALIWNRKYSKAASYIESLSQKHPDRNWVRSLLATLNLYKSNFKRASVYYKEMLVKDSASFDANLGLANSYKAMEQLKKARQAAFRTLQFYPNQKDAVNFIKNIERSLTPELDQQVSYTFDNGDNEAFSSVSKLKLPLNYVFSSVTSLDYRTTRNKRTDNQASTITFQTGLAWDVSSKIRLNGHGGILKASSFSGDYTSFIGSAFANLKLLKLQDIEMGYQREVQNFNADLLDQAIISNNYYINHNLNTNFNLGWFTQYFYTSQSDSNERNLFFTSLYYNIFRKPILKAGINYQYISFKNQVPGIYFSPERFNAVELFTDFLKPIANTPAKEWFYQLSAAGGYQFIEDNEKQATYRFNGILGYKFSNRLHTSVYAKHSNIASATAAGFTFTELGFQLKWLITSKPLFRLNP